MKQKRKEGGCVLLPVCLPCSKGVLRVCVPRVLGVCVPGGCSKCICSMGVF